MKSKFINKNDETIKNEMLDRISTDVRSMAGTFINDNLSPISIELAELYMDIEFVGNKLNPDNLIDEELDSYVESRTPIIRKPATKAHGFITVKGKKDKLIPKGTAFTNGNYNYYSTSSAILNNGTANIPIECEIAGEVGNSLSKTIKYLVHQDIDIEYVTNTEDILGGYDKETDADLLERYYEYVRATPTSGNKAHYKMWAESVPGVGIAKTIPLWNGDNTVKVVITDSNTSTADSKLVKKVQDFIDPGKKGLGSEVAPVGAVVTVVSAKPKALNIKVDLVTNRVDTSLKKDIEDSINKYLKEINFKYSEVSYAKIGLSILSVEGINDYKNLTINDAKDNVILKDDEVAVLESFEVV